MAIAALTASMSAPPYCSGMLSPSRPSAAPLRTAAQLNSLFSSTSCARGSTSLATKSWTVRCQLRCSSLRSKSILIPHKLVCGGAAERRTGESPVRSVRTHCLNVLPGIVRRQQLAGILDLVLADEDLHAPEPIDHHRVDQVADGFLHQLHFDPVGIQIALQEIGLRTTVRLRQHFPLQVFVIHTASRGDALKALYAR